MLNRMKSKLKLKKTDNQGAAIVIVILAIAFVGMLVAMMAYMSYMNFVMKGTDRSAKDNFYSAETALDEINVGLQSEISYAMTNAYTDVMKMASLQEENKRRTEFRDKFSDELVELLEVKVDGEYYESDTENPSKYAKRFISHLKSYWKETPVFEETDDGAGGVITYGAKLELLDMGHDDVCRVYFDTEKQILKLRGIKITYTDEKGFVSIIQTDIVVTVPDLNFAAASEISNLTSYTLVASTDTSVKTVAESAEDTAEASRIPQGYEEYFTDYSKYESVVSKEGANTVITGDVYGGRNGFDVKNNSTVRFETNDNYATETSTYTVVAGALKASNLGSIISGTETTKTGTSDAKATPVINVENINLDAADVNLNGFVKVRDDLNLDGRKVSRKGVTSGSRAIISGKYYGYGDASTKSENSSSILLNGARCTLDMSDLTELVLRGHAYVGAMHYNPRTNIYSDYLENPKDVENYYDDPDVLDSFVDYTKDKNKNFVIPDNKQDIILGQSLATKSDQILYMVPTECMVYDTYDPDVNVPDHVAKGSRKKQVLAKNPLTYAEYLKYASEQISVFANNQEVKTNGVALKRKRYEMVNLNKTIGGLNKDISAYGASYVPVVRKVSGNWLVYYYLTFDTESHANKYFADYFNANPDAMKRYADEYIENISINSNVKALMVNGKTRAGDNILSLAGNFIYFDVVNGEREYKLVGDTLENEMTTKNSEGVSEYNQLTDVSNSCLDEYLGYSHKLLPTSSLLTAEELKKTPRDNIIVSDSELNKLCGGRNNKATYFVNKTTVGDTTNVVVAAIILNEDDKTPYNLSDIKYVEGGVTYNPSIVIATGDLNIDRNNEGLIWCRNANIKSSCTSLVEDPKSVKAAFKAKHDDKYFYEALINGISYVDFTAADEGSLEQAEIEEERKKDYIVLSDLIQYDNWKKE